MLVKTLCPDPIYEQYKCFFVRVQGEGKKHHKKGVRKDEQIVNLI
jgi:hypothetical protein